MKNSINKVTGLQVGYTTEWVVLDSGIWRALTDEELTLCEAEEATMQLARAKEAKRNAIREEFETQSNEPVVVSSVSYHGGYDSTMKLDGAKRMAELSGMTSVEFFDINNVGHTLTLTEAQEVILAVGGDYQARFANKQARMNALEACTTVEEVEAM